MRLGSLLLVAGLAGCGPGVTSVTLEPKETVLVERRATTLLRATPSDPSGALVPRALLDIEWSSSDPSVATVVNGTVTALKSGKTVITARVDDRTATAEVRVRIPEGLALSSNAVEIVGLGKSAQLAATMRDDAGQPVPDAEVTWETSTPTVATVINGRVEAVGVGSATITASIGKLTSAARVVVRYPEIERIDMSPKGPLWFARAGESVRISATLRDPQGAPIHQIPVSWSTSDPSVVSVSTEGVVTALKKGKAKVMLSAPNQNVEIDARVVN